MQLAATREVTREEDTAYSLMGIFDISISTAYGEGAPRAFLRLVQEILVSSANVLDILNWAGGLPPSLPYNSRILPSSPTYYINCSSNPRVTLRWSPPIEPLTLSPMGLRVPVILMPARIYLNPTSRRGPIGDYNATVDIMLIESSNMSFTYNVLDGTVSGPDGPYQWVTNSQGYWNQITLAVFNFTGTPNLIYLPKTYIAIALLCDEPAGEVSTAMAECIRTLETKEPIVFELSRTTTDDEPNYDNPWTVWHIERKLATHGMQLISLYL